MLKNFLNSFSGLNDFCNVLLFIVVFVHCTLL